MKEINRWLLLNAAMTVVLVLIVAAIAVAGWKSNHDRIGDIQSSRIESCQRTYEGVRQVFRPLMPPPALQTPKQKKDIQTFNGRIERLKNGCERQVSAPKVKP